MEQAKVPVCPPVLASVSDDTCPLMKSSVAAGADLVNPQPLVPKAAAQIFTNVDYDAVADAPIALHPWQPEDDKCLRQLVGSGPDTDINWEAMATQFNQMRSVSLKERDWLDHEQNEAPTTDFREHEQNQAPVARTAQALRIRWDRLQQQKHGVKCRICESNFMCSDFSWTPEDIDSMVGEDGRIICEFCASSREEDVHSTSWALRTDLAEESLDMPSSDAADINETHPWESDTFPDASAIGDEGDSEKYRTLQVGKRRKRLSLAEALDAANNAARSWWL